MTTEYITTPFTIAVDTREQMPYRFDGFKGDSVDGYAPLAVLTEKKTLQTGDYSIVGLEDRFTVERKSIDDAYQTFVHDRVRFKRELERMSAMERAFVCIETTEDAFYGYVDTQTGGSVKSIYRCMRYWPIDFGVHFLWSGSRMRAMRDTLRMCQRFWAIWGKAVEEV